MVVFDDNIEQMKTESKNELGAQQRGVTCSLGSNHGRWDKHCERGDPWDPVGSEVNSEDGTVTTSMNFIRQICAWEVTDRA